MEAERKSSRYRCFCGQCGCGIHQLDRWVCQACEADLREAGVVRRRSVWTDHVDFFRLPWRRLMHRRRVRDVPTCRGCGYPLRGAVSLECPECGTDWSVPTRLEQVRRWPIGRLAVFYFAVLLFVAWSAGSWQGGKMTGRVSCDQFFPWVDESRVTVTMFPASGAFGDAKLVGSGQTWRWAWQRSRTIPIRNVTVTVQPNSYGNDALPPQVTWQCHPGADERAVFRERVIEAATSGSVAPTDAEIQAMWLAAADIGCGRYTGPSSGYLLPDTMPGLAGRLQDGGAAVPGLNSAVAAAEQVGEPSTGTVGQHGEIGNAGRAHVSVMSGRFDADMASQPIAWGAWPGRVLWFGIWAMGAWWLWKVWRRWYGRTYALPGA